MTLKSFLLKRTRILVSIFLIAISNNLPAQDPARFFNRNDLMTIGSYYYPEHWPKEYWAKDLKKMAEVGFEFTHYGEFTWSFIEPEAGRFDFTWLDEAVELAYRNGLKVIMCTSSPTPPAWLAQKHSSRCCSSAL